MSQEDAEAIVIDNGSGFCKAGIAGYENPFNVSRSFVGRHKYRHSTMFPMFERDCFICENAQYHASILSINCPIEHGIIKNWDDMERIWDHIFYKIIKMDPTEHPLLAIDTHINAKFGREKMMSIMFDTFNVPSFYVVNSGYLSLIATCRTEGIVLEIGEGTTQIVPVYDNGLIIPDAITRLDFAGNDITEFMNHRLNYLGYNFISTSEKEIVRKIKEKICYVAQDYSHGNENVVSANYTLPDGNVATVGMERVMCPELLFKPWLYGKTNCGIHEAVYESIMKCDYNYHRNLYAKIVLSGGTTMLKGLPNRLWKEIRALSPATDVNIIQEKDRQNLAWQGGSIWASLETFPQFVIKREEYEEEGPIILRRKCNAILKKRSTKIPSYLGGYVSTTG